MTDYKPPLASRTLWANLVGLVALLLAALGIDTGALEADRLAEALAQFVAAGSFIASTLFRVVATDRLKP
jgi:hypothetical protein